MRAVTDRAERFEPGAVLHGSSGPLVVASARRHRDRWLVRFEGITDRTAAEALRGVVLTAEPLAGEPDTLWVHELVGSTVVTVAGETLGRVEAVEANPAHDLLVLAGGVLVPVVFVVDHEPGRVVVDLPEGLVELHERGR